MALFHTQYLLSTYYLQAALGGRRSKAGAKMTQLWVPFQELPWTLGSQHSAQKAD